MTEIQHIGVLSVAKMLAIVYAVLGLIIGLLFSLMALAGAALGAEDAGGYAIVFGIGAVIVMPIAYAIGGFVLGAIVTWVYNIAAGMVGGVNVRLVNRE